MTHWPDAEPEPETFNPNNKAAGGASPAARSGETQMIPIDYTVQPGGPVGKPECDRSRHLAWDLVGLIAEHGGASTLPPSPVLAQRWRVEQATAQAWRDEAVRLEQQMRGER